MKPFLFLLGAFLFFSISSSILATGNLDPGFNGIGKSVFNIEDTTIPASFSDVFVLGNGKSLVVGQAQIASNSYYAITLTRYNADGSLDTSFGSGGKIISDLGVNSYGQSVAVQSDGKIVVIGNAGKSLDLMTAVIRYTPNGMLDTTFGNNGIFFSSVMKESRDIVVLTDDKIIVAGVSNIPNLGRSQVAKLNANGTLDTTFGTNGITTSTHSGGSDTDKVAIQSDGKIVISGKNLGNVSSALIHRFNTDGSPDTTFGTNGIREIPSSSGSMFSADMAIQPDGKIVLTGFTAAPGWNNTQFYLTRLNSDGSTDTSFGDGFVFHDLTGDYERAYDMTLQPDGKILIGGHRAANQGIVARFDINGALDSGFGTGGVAAVSANSNVAAVGLQGSNIVAVGSTQSGGLFAARLDQTGSTLSFRNENFVLGKNDQARDVAVQTDGKIVVAGISEGTNRSVGSVARLLPGGALDNTFGTGGKVVFNENLNQSEVNAVEIQPDGKILLAGTHSEVTLSQGSLFVVRLNADGTFDQTFGTGGKVIINLIPDLVGYDMELQSDGKIVIAGSALQRVGDGIYDYDMLAARLNVNGTPDGGFGNNGVFIYATGSAQSRSNEESRTLSILPDGKIILAGTHLFRLNADSTIDTAFSPTPVALGFTTTDIKLQPDGKMLFNILENSNFAVARYSNTSLDTTFGNNGIATLDFGGTDRAKALYLEPDGDILAGGSTTFGGDASRRNFALARFKPNGSPDESFGSGGKVVTDFGGDAEILGLTGQTNGKIVAAGSAKLSLDRDYALARYSAGTSPSFDFDGDGKTDVSIFRPNQGEWWYLKSSGGNSAVQFGNSADKPIPADYTGDGKTDLAFWRNGQWFILRSEDYSYYGFAFGSAGDIPVPADYDGDGRADPSVFRPSTNVWYIGKSSGGTDILQFGAAGDKPVVGDYDGDGKTDVAIFRPANAEWWIRKSSNGGVFALKFGNSADKPVPADFTGDGKTDVAVFRPSNGNWFILRSEDFSFYGFPFGLNGDLPVVGDYDGDGKADVGVFRPSNNAWYMQRSTAGILIQTFGIAGDQPIPNVFVP